jgi:hypothetical protein
LKTKFAKEQIQIQCTSILAYRPGHFDMNWSEWVTWFAIAMMKSNVIRSVLTFWNLNFKDHQPPGTAALRVRDASEHWNQCDHSFCEKSAQFCQ